VQIHGEIPRRWTFDVIPSSGEVQKPGSLHYNSASRLVGSEKNTYQSRSYAILYDGTVRAKSSG
jgi:hypothetical protein